MFTKYTFFPHFHLMTVTADWLITVIVKVPPSLYKPDNVVILSLVRTTKMAYRRGYISCEC